MSSVEFATTEMCNCLHLEVTSRIILLTPKRRVQEILPTLGNFEYALPTVQHSKRNVLYQCKMDSATSTNARHLKYTVRFRREKPGTTEKRLIRNVPQPYRGWC